MLRIDFTRPTESASVASADAPLRRRRAARKLARRRRFAHIPYACECVHVHELSLQAGDDEAVVEAIVAASAAEHEERKAGQAELDAINELAKPRHVRTLGHIMHFGARGGRVCFDADVLS